MMIQKLCRIIHPYPVSIILLCLLAGCAGMTFVDLETDDGSFSWQPTNVIRNVNQLIQIEESGEYRDVVEYMATQMTGVQPVFGDSLTVQLQGDRRVIHGATLGDVGGEGRMFWPDFRSDAGSGIITALKTSENAVLNEGTAIMVPEESLTDDHLRDLSENGARMILSVGKVEHHLAAARGIGVLLLQVTLEALAEITRLPAGHVDMQMLSEKSYTLPEPVRMEARIKRHESPLNTMGFIAGQNPDYASELVIVAMDPEWSVPDSEFSKWLPAALLLELLRKHAAGSATGAFPRRTILVIMGNGAALHAALEYPIWDRQKIHSILMLGQAGNGSIQKSDGEIPFWGHPIPEISEPEGTHDQIRAALNDLDTAVQQLDQLVPPGS